MKHQNEIEITAPLMENFKKALRKLKKELKYHHFTHRSYGIVMFYDNDAVRCYVRTPGDTNSSTIFSFGNYEEAIFIGEESLVSLNLNEVCDKYRWFV